jgi:hypothetical protein
MTGNHITLLGTVQKLIDRTAIREPEQAQIHLIGADYLYDELRIPNTRKWKAGTGIEVTIRLLQQAGASNAA